MADEDELNSLAYVKQELKAGGFTIFDRLRRNHRKYPFIVLQMGGHALQPEGTSVDIVSAVVFGANADADGASSALLDATEAVRRYVRAHDVLLYRGTDAEAEVEGHLAASMEIWRVRQP